MRVRVFIDYWNFQLMWNERTDFPCDWRRLPGVLTQEGSKITSQASLGGLSLEEARVYAGYEAGRLCLCRPNRSPSYPAARKI